jgi:membrane protein implicated in regulation of membrane protease activity
MPNWRKATWSIVIWSGLILAWVLTGLAANVSVIGQIVTWFVGSVLLVLVWMMSRSRFTTEIFGPQGQHRTVTAKNAKGRVERRGWSYTRPAPDAVSGPGAS